MENTLNKKYIEILQKESSFRIQTACTIIENKLYEISQDPNNEINPISGASLNEEREKGSYPSA